VSSVTNIKIEPELSNRLDIIKSEVSSASVKQVLDAIPALVEARSVNAFELGGYLSRVQTGELWPKENMSFNLWMDSQGIAKSTGLAKIQIYKAVVGANLPGQIVEDIGSWPKFLKIAPLLRSGTSKATEYNETAITKAKTLTKDALNDWVAMEKSKTSKPKKHKLVHPPLTVKDLRPVMKQIHPEDVFELFVELWPDFNFTTGKL